MIKLKYNKLFIMAVLLVVIFTVGAVNAENSTEVTINETQSIEDVNEGSFEELSDKIQNATEFDTLTLEKDYKYMGGSTEGIYVNKSITIDGQGHTVDGGNASRIFNIFFEKFEYDNYMSITFRNLTFINGISDEKGGAINLYQESPDYDDPDYGNRIVLKDCIFVNNKAKTGGAIYCDAHSSFKNCNFLNNSATSRGGALYLEGMTNIADCNFAGNGAEFAGSVYWTRGDVSDSNFTNNNATSGGAMFYSGLGSLMRDYDNTVNNCIFCNNSATYAGAIYGSNGRFMHKLSITDCMFSDNSAKEDGGALIWDGGVTDVGSGYVSNCTFANNSAKKGGSLYAGNWAYINDCVFEDNHAEDGGAFYQKIDDYYYNEKTTNCTFIHNSATVGGATYSIIEEYPFINCTFVNNAAVNGSAMYGGKAINCKIIDDSAQSEPIQISASQVSTVYNGGKYVVATLKDSSGSPLVGLKVTFKLSTGKTSSLTTNEKGQVKLTTNALAPKTYTVTFTFKGNDKYQNATKSVKVIVKKATPKLTAAKKTFKKSVKTKKYVITLKTNQNKVMKNTKVTFKVKGKIYSAKTNSKGKATFKITKFTKKGKVIAAITYKGDKYYNKVVKKVQITIK